MTRETGSLDLLAREGAEFAQRCVALAREAKRGLIFHPWTERTRALAGLAAREAPSLRLLVHQGDPSAAGALPAAGWDEADAVVLDSAPGSLPSDLLQLVDLPHLRVLAPRTEDYFRTRPLFIISIPKSGTHLLYKLAEVLGYAQGVVHEEFPVPGQWYCVEYSNSHTVARDFFVDTVRRSPFGNRHHAFASAPAIFIYRHPLDVLVSEANYYHREGKTAFAGYLSALSFGERVHRLLDDPWLLGSIRDRITGFAPWLDFPNVIPVSFEELVGAEGGGSREDQLRLIWSLQLKLQVPGSPHAFADRVFDRDSPTFYQGRIGAWRASLSEGHLARFRALNQDFMETFGYSLDEAADGVPRRATEFRKRPLRIASPQLDDVPITLEYNYLGFNLLRYSGWIYAVPQPLGPGFKLDEQQAHRLQMLPRARSLPELRHRLSLASVLWGGHPELMAHNLSARLSGVPAWRRWLRALLGVTGLLDLAVRLGRGRREGKQ